MNIFYAIFGNPATQQAAINVKFNHAVIALNDAKLVNDKIAQRAALAQMRIIANQGSKEAAAALSVANAPDKIAAMAKRAGTQLKNSAYKTIFYATGAALLAVYVYGLAKK